MAEFINTVSVIGDDAVVDGLLVGTLTEYKEDRVTRTGNYSFYKCFGLKTIVMPNVTIFERYTAYNCTGLETVDLKSVTSINAASLQGCSSLKALILRGDTLCSLENTSALTGTPIASGTGYVYIPAALKDSYAAATNWATYAAQFRDLESYTVDGTVTGELDETKIAA